MVYVNSPNACPGMLKALKSVGYTGEDLRHRPVHVAAGAARRPATRPRACTSRSRSSRSTAARDDANLMLAALQKYGPKDLALDSIAQAGFCTVMNIQAALDGVNDLDTQVDPRGVQGRPGAPELPRPRLHVRRQAARRQHRDLQRLPEDQAGQGRQGHHRHRRLGHGRRPLHAASPLASVLLRPLPAAGPRLGRRLRHPGPGPGAQAPRAGVIDFGHGAVAMFVAYVYLGLRNEGTLQFPWVVIPHEISFGSPLGDGAGDRGRRSSMRRCWAPSCTG